MESKNRKLDAVRIVLDVLMLLLAATMFNRRAISQTYHEIAGLALMAIFIAHLVINRKMLKSLAGKQSAGKARRTVMLALDIALCAAWLAVLVTSVLVSQEIFPFNVRMLHPWHKFAAALALLITGVHFGMHWKWFWGMIRKAFSNRNAVKAVLLTFVAIFGCYCLCTSSYLSWISAPFTPRQTRGEGRFRGNGEYAERRGEYGSRGDGEDAPWEQRTEGSTEPAPADETADAPRQTPSEDTSEDAPEREAGERYRGDGEDGEGRRGRLYRGEGEEDGSRGYGRRGRRNRGDGEEDGAWREGRRGRNNGGGGSRRRGGDWGRGYRFLQRSGGFIRFFGSFVKGLGILLFFGAVTHGVDRLLCRKKETDGASPKESE